MSEDWLRAFPDLGELEEGPRRQLLQASHRVRLPAGVEPFRTGAPCESYIFVVSGCVRVQMLAENGREIVLYRVGAGETCILTTACLLSGESYPASAVTETAVEGALLPAPVFRTLLDGSAAFRDCVFRTYGRRLATLMALIEEVLFRRLDVRLAELLLTASAHGTAAIAATHQEMAAELGSAREVVSRLLKDFERRGWVTLARGSIAVTAPDGLRALRAERGG